MPSSPSTPQQQASGSFFSFTSSSRSLPPSSSSQETQFTTPFATTTTSRNNGTATSTPYPPGPASSIPTINTETERRAIAESLFLPIGSEGQTGLETSTEQGTPEWRHRAEIASAVFGYERQYRSGETIQIDTLRQLQDDLARLGSDDFLDFLKIRLEALIGVVSEPSDQDIPSMENERPEQVASGDMSQPSQLNSSNSSQTCVYLLTGPHGYEALLMPPRENITSNPTDITIPHPFYSTVGTSQLNPFLPAINAFNPPNQIRHQGLPFPHLRPQRLRRNSLRINGHRRPQNVQIAYINLSTWLRRIWVFIRLYFLAYLISEDHTLLRYGLVIVALIASLASGTSYPQMIYNAAIAPIHRHIENLIPLDIDLNDQQLREEGTGAPTGDVDATRQQQPAGTAHTAANRLRSWERSTALFMATLIPGIGERHVAARAAAREAAEARRRDEAQRREQEQHEQQEQQTGETAGAETAVGDSSNTQTAGDAITTGRETAGDTRPDALRSRGTAEATSA